MKTTSEVTTRKMSAYWLTLLLLNGINVYPGHGKRANAVKWLATAYPWLICAFWTFITTSVLTSLAYRRTSYEDTIEMLTYITGSSSTLALFVIGMHKRPALLKMLDIIRDEFWCKGRGRCGGGGGGGGSGRNVDDRPAAEELYARFVRTYGTVFPVAALFMCLTPIFWVAKYGDIDSPAALIFRMWTPWQQLTATKYAITYAVQFVVSMSVLINITGMVLAMVLFVNEMQVQVDVLADAVRGLDVDTAYDGRRTNATRTRDRLVRCVKHHQTLIAYFNHFKSYFNVLFVVEIVYIMVMTCLGASSVLMAKGFSAFHIKMISLLIIVVSQFFFYCLIGETFSLMNQQLGDCFYFKLVQCKCKELSRVGCLVVLRTQRPLQLTAAGMTRYTASLLTFTVTMKSAYAGLNVLYNASK